MRRLVIVPLAAVALLGIAGAAFAKPIKAELKQNMVKVTATNVAKDRSGTEEFVKLVLDSSHRTEERLVTGTIRLKKEGEDDVICEFSALVPAADKVKQDLRDCSRHEPDAIEIVDLAVSSPGSTPAPDGPPPTEPPSDPEPGQE